MSSVHFFSFLASSRFLSQWPAHLFHFKTRLTFLILDFYCYRLRKPAISLFFISYHQRDQEFSIEQAKKAPPKMKSFCVVYYYYYLRLLHNGTYHYNGISVLQQWLKNNSFNGRIRFLLSNKSQILIYWFVTLCYKIYMRIDLTETAFIAMPI